jgi:hypothetical protein
MLRPTSHIPLLCAFGLGVTFVVSGGCSSGAFKGGGKKSAAIDVQPTPSPRPTGNSPNEPNPVGPGPTPTAKPTARPTVSPGPVCSPRRKPARIAIVIDNSGSHGRSDGELPQPHETWYTDPVRLGMTATAPQRRFTLRQKAIHEVVLALSVAESQARALDPRYVGTALGIASFPKSRDEGNAYTVHSGRGPLPTPMTNLADVPFDDARGQALWEVLAFTHSPDGITPFAVGLEAARALLASDRKAVDSRPEHVILVSDGLPTDERPSRVIAARSALGDGVAIHLMNVRKDASTSAEALRTSRDGLRSWFLAPPPEMAWPWARNPADNDGYEGSEAGFNRYWSDLTKLPERIAQKEITVEIDALRSELGALIGSIGCP